MQAKAVSDVQAVGRGQDFKVCERTDPYVGRVVPLVRQTLGHRHASLQHLESIRPVRKVRESHHANATNSCRFAQHHLGIAKVLQRVNLQHHVEGVVVKHGQALVQVQLQHAHTCGYTRLDFGVVNFNTIARALAVCLQVSQHGTVATA